MLISPDGKPILGLPQLGKDGKSLFAADDKVNHSYKYDKNDSDYNI